MEPVLELYNRFLGTGSYVKSLQLSVLFTVHTNAIFVTIRISIGDPIAGVKAATKTFAPGGKHPRAATGCKQSSGFGSGVIKDEYISVDHSGLTK